MNWAIWKRGIIAFAVLILNACATPGSGGLRPSQSEFDSQWVEIAAGSAYGEIGKPLALMLILKNKTDRALWVHVGFTSPDPAQSCTSAKQLAPKGSATYTCAQRQLVADVPYPISVAAFSDQALTQNLETKQTKLQFKAQDLATLMEMVTPPQLPATFSDVWYRTDEALLLIAYKEKGTLIVAADKLIFNHSSGSVEVPMAAIKKVEPRKRMGMVVANHWVVVEYRVGGNDALIAFKYAPFSGKTSDSEIYSAISWAREKK